MKHYIKNLLVFFPMFFGGVFFDVLLWEKAIAGFMVFCAAASAVYIVNDIMDAKNDRLHPTKKMRPIASGEISVGRAWLVFGVCIAIAIFLSILMRTPFIASILLAVYVIINLAYSRGLKNIPILDVTILASGYVIRVYYGGLITDIVVSEWLFLVITAGALYMGLGKRMGELRSGSESREVLKKYTEDFLKSAMTLMMALTIVFYALWARELNNRKMLFSVPVFIVIMLRYAMVSEKRSDGDPVEVILGDVPLMALLTVYGIFVTGMLYFA